MKLVLTARRAEKLDSLAGEMGKSDCVVVVVDIAVGSSPQQLLDRALERFGRLDVVFNSAGIMHAGTIEEVMNTPIGHEQRLVAAGIKLPALVDSGHVDDVHEHIDHAELDRLTKTDSKSKWFGPDSEIELTRGSLPSWYRRGFAMVTVSCVGLVAGTWLLTRVLFVWND